MTPARQILAEAIEAVITAERELDVTCQAIESAQSKKWEVQRSLDKLLSETKGEASPHGGAYIASIRAGRDCDVTALARADDQREEDLRVAIDTWSKTQASCEKMKEQAIEVRDYAMRERKKAAARVAAEECAIAAKALMVGMRELHEEVRRRRSILTVLSRQFRADDNELSRHIDALISRGINAPFDSVSDFNSQYTSASEHPDAQEWLRAIDALEHSAETKLPVGKTEIKAK